MKDKNTYVYLGEVYNNILKVSLPVIENMKEFDISKEYILNIINKIGKEELENKKTGKELAISDEDKDCMIILSIKKDFLGLDHISPREVIGE